MRKTRIAALLWALALLLLTVAACGAAAQEEAPPPEDFPPFPATVLEIGENSLLVLADEGADVRRSSDQFWVTVAGAELLDEAGNPLALTDLWWYDRVEVVFTGGINESYPAQAAASKITRLPKAALTREDLLTLAQRADELDWVDFAPYESADVGSGLYILQFDIDEDYFLLVGGVPGERPWYAHLCTRETDGFVDILGEDFSMDQLFPEEAVIPSAEGEAVASSSEGDYPAAIQIGGKIYHLYQPMPAEIDPSAILGETTSYTDGWPAQDGETNFSRTLGLPYAQVEGGMAVLYENEWWFCYEVK